MHRLVATAALALNLAVSGLGAHGEAQTRTVYVSAVDKAGSPVRDLRPDELVIKLDGKWETVLAARPAVDRMHLAIVVHNPGQPSTGLRDGLTGFVEALRGKADVAIFTTLHPSATVVDFTPDASKVAEAIRHLLPDPPLSSRERAQFHPVAGPLVTTPAGMTTHQIVKDLVHQFEMRAVPRPVIVLVQRPPTVDCLSAPASEGWVGCNSSRHARDETTRDYFNPPVYGVSNAGGVGVDLLPMFERTRAVLFAIGASSFEVARASGGYAERATDDRMATAMGNLAADLAAQYAVTFDIGSISKDGAKLRVESTRPGVTIRAPERVR